MGSGAASFRSRRLMAITIRSTEPRYQRGFRTPCERRKGSDRMERRWARCPQVLAIVAAGLLVGGWGTRLNDQEYRSAASLGDPSAALSTGSGPSPTGEGDPGGAGALSSGEVSAGASNGPSPGSPAAAGASSDVAATNAPLP